MDATWNQLIILLNVALAGALGGVIGVERELRGKPAGFRTHMVVAAAAALLMALAPELVDYFADHGEAQSIRSDPIRVIEAIITGISFLGAGTILVHRGRRRVEGLTTAASLLLVAAIGISTALHRYVLAVGITALLLLVLVVLGFVEKWLARRHEATS